MIDDAFHQWATATDATAPASGMPDELWAAADVIESQPTLGAALIDPGHAPEQRTQVVEGVFGNTLTTTAVAAVGQAAALEWPDPAALVAALRRMAVRQTWRLAEATGVADDVHGQVAQVADTVLGQPRLELILNGAGVPAEQRRGVVAELCGELHPLARQVAGYAVVDDGRGYVDALEDWLDEASDIRGHQRVRAAFAQAPDAAQSRRLASELERIYGKPVDVEIHLDAAVIGGARLRIGDDVIDGSVAARLEQARRDISGQA